METKRTRASSFSLRTRPCVRASCAVIKGHASAHVVKTKLTTRTRPRRLSDFTVAPAWSTSVNDGIISARPPEQAASSTHASTAAGAAQRAHRAPPGGPADCEVQPDEPGDREEEEQARPRQLEAPHRHAEDGMPAPVLDQRLARDQRDGVGGGRCEPDDAAGILPHRVETDVVRDAPETGDQDSEDRRLAGPEAGQAPRRP